MDKIARSSKIALIVTALFLVAALPITSVNAAPSEESEFFYGVEYDWSSIDSDLTNFTGLDLPEIFTEVMGAADDSGFDLIIGQLMTGSSNVYIHHTEDISPQTIQDIDGDSVSVWSRTTDVTLRHGGLVDGILMTDWSESTFGMDTTGFDIDITSSSQNVLSVDILYTEYLDDSYNLIGADMDFSMNTYTSTSFDFDATFEGDGEELPIDFNVAMSFGYSITDSSSQWRLESPDPIYVGISSDDSYGWDAHGDLFGDYDGSIDYSLSVTGIPTEDIGLDSGEFDIEISDLLTQTDGGFDIENMGGSFDFLMGDEMTVDLGDGNGLTTQVQSCDNCPPGNPLMFVMMGNVIGGASEAFVDDIGESFSEGLSENLVELFDVGGDDDDDYDDEYYDDWFYCDSGDVIYSWQQNNGYPDCYDGSDEEILMADMSYSNNQDRFINMFTITNEMLNLNADWPYYTCDDGTMIEWNKLNDESWGDFDCESGEDEYDFEMIEDSMFTCDDDSEILLSKVNDGNDDCMYGEDEPEYGDIELTEWYCGEDDVALPLSEVNNGIVDCTGGWDEPRYDASGSEISDFECEDGSFILLSQVNDGDNDCDDEDDESYYEYDVEISEFHCYEIDQIIPLSEVNNEDENCEFGSDEPKYAESDVEIIYTCSDGTDIFWSQVNDGTGDCGDFADEGVMDKYTLNYNIITEDGIVLYSDSYDLCGQYIESACDDSIFYNNYYFESPFSPSMNYGSNVYCINAELIDDSTNMVVSTVDLKCEDYYYGPQIYEGNVYEDEDEVGFSITAYSSDSMMDVDMEVSFTGPNNQVIYSSTEEIEYGYNEVMEMFAVSEDGEYCLEVELIADGETTPFHTHFICEDVSSEGEPSDRLETIAMAFSESSIGDVLEMFGENLQQRLEDTEPFETFPYNDGLWAPMWSNEHGAIVGIGVYAMDDDGAYTMAGPNTVGYMDDAPAKMSIRYLTGVEAGNAASSMESADEIDEIVDVEQHDLEQITQDLEDAGIDTSGLELPGNVDGNDDTTTTPETAEDSAEDDGLLPFVSPISVIAVIALAGAIISSRKENE